jgi:hypothetical protein
MPFVIQRKRLEGNYVEANGREVLKPLHRFLLYGLATDQVLGHVRVKRV